MVTTRQREEWCERCLHPIDRSEAPFSTPSEADRRLGDLIGHKDPGKAGRAMAAMMQMKKLDIAALKRAHDAV